MLINRMYTYFKARHPICYQTKINGENGYQPKTAAKKMWKAIG